MKLGFMTGIIGGAVLAMGLTTQAATAESLRVGMECTYYPFNYKETSGDLAGYDVDVANGIAEIIDAEIEFVCQEWDGIIPALLANKYDLIIASLSITEKRKEKIDYSIPYRVSIGRLIGEDGKGLELFDADGQPIADNFNGLTVGVERASNYADWFAATLPNVDIKFYDGTEPLYLDMKNGRVDLIITNPMKGHLVFMSGENEGKYEFYSPPLSDEEFFGPGVGVGMRKGNDELRGRIDAALKQLIQTGKLEEYALKIFPWPIHNEQWGE
jgi:arginine/ornithine transport system substrate-binding protein